MTREGASCKSARSRKKRIDAANVKVHDLILPKEHSIFIGTFIVFL